LDADVIVDLLVVAGLETVNFTPDLGSKLPLQCAALLIDGVKVLVCAAHIHETILNGWRRNHAPGGLKFPFDAGELRDACGAIEDQCVQDLLGTSGCPGKLWAEGRNRRTTEVRYDFIS
jgi:hypothetical protein